MDLIDRQAAIDALCSECQGRCVPCNHYPCNEVKALKELPSAEPRCIATIQLSREQLDEAFEKVKADILSVKPKTGKWIEVYAESDYRDGWIEFTCENCEYQHGLESGQYGWHYGDDIPWKYCPICGSYNGGGDAE